MAWKLPRAHYRFDENFPKRRLYLNILAEADEEEGARYQFGFLREDGSRDATEKHCWFRVSDIRAMQRSADIIRWTKENLPPDDLFDRALETLSLLYEVVHVKPMITYYEESSQENRQGAAHIYSHEIAEAPLSRTQTSCSPLRLHNGITSTPRKEIQDLVDDLNRIGRGFNFSKDFVLKAGLMLCDVDVVFRVANFNKSQHGYA